MESLAPVRAGLSGILSEYLSGWLIGNNSERNDARFVA